MYSSIILIYCLEVVCSFLFNVSCLLLLFLLEGGGGGVAFVCVCVCFCVLVLFLYFVGMSVWKYNYQQNYIPFKVNIFHWLMRLDTSHCNAEEGLSLIRKI